ncbi:MAG: glutamate-5-semialdehyde dehydrogenase [Lachnospiraceae bacterium]
MMLQKIGKKAEKAKFELQSLTTEEKNSALAGVARALVGASEEILAQNKIDIEKAKADGMSASLVDRLLLTKERIEGMAEGLMQVTSLEDPIGEVLEAFCRPNGLEIKKVRVPLGVIGIIYESRPNVTADAFSLCFKTGNAVILKGGSDAIHSNISIAEVIRGALLEQNITPDAIQMIESTDRAVTAEFMKLKEYVDVLIPRGGAGLIRTVVENSTIPVIETGTGNCHIFIDEEADLDMAIPILINAKTQRTGVCNACESLLIHKDIVEKVMPLLQKALSEKSVEVRGDETVVSHMPEAILATTEDYAKEFLDLILSVKVVEGVEEAITHINTYNTKHSDAIITDNAEHAEQFLNGVDASCVYVNASTRFTDGFEFGFGAEIGISTQKLHARGPMGLKELTSYKYQVVGTGQIR